MKSELNNKIEELEQTLQMQLSIVKKESGDFVKIGGVLLAGAGLAFLAFRLLSRKKDNTKRVLEVLEKEGLLDKEIQDKLTSKRQPGLIGRLGAILLPIAVNYGREQFMNRLNEPKRKPEEDAK
jgi:hypothetical protein